MKKHSVFVTPMALEDMESIFNYIANELKSVNSAKNQYNNIADSIVSLDSMPERCPIFDNEPERSMEIRRLIVDNYLVCYIVQDSKVIVTDVLYGASDLHNILGERHIDNK